MIINIQLQPGRTRTTRSMADATRAALAHTKRVGGGAALLTETRDSLAAPKSALKQGDLVEAWRETRDYDRVPPSSTSAPKAPAKMRSAWEALRGELDTLSRDLPTTEKRGLDVAVKTWDPASLDSERDRVAPLSYAVPRWSVTRRTLSVYGESAGWTDEFAAFMAKNVNVIASVQRAVTAFDAEGRKSLGLSDAEVGVIASAIAFVESHGKPDAIGQPVRGQAWLAKRDPRWIDDQHPIFAAGRYQILLPGLEKRYSRMYGTLGRSAFFTEVSKSSTAYLAACDALGAKASDEQRKEAFVNAFQWYLDAPDLQDASFVHFLADHKREILAQDTLVERVVAALEIWYNGNVEKGLRTDARQPESEDTRRAARVLTEATLNTLSKE